MGNDGRKGLAISGGGAFGVYAGSVIQYLIKDLGRDYDIVVGPMMAPLTALGKVDLLRGFVTVSK